MSVDTLFEEYPNKLWKTPQSYGGHDPVGEMVIAARSRDSGLIENHNYLTALARVRDVMEKLQLPDNNEFCYWWSARHWAVGWVEYLMLSPVAHSDLKTCVLGILKELEDGMLDPELYQERLWETAEDTWSHLDDDEKIEMQKAVIKQCPEASSDDVISLCIELVAQDYIVE